MLRMMATTVVILHPDTSYDLGYNDMLGSKEDVFMNIMSAMFTNTLVMVPMKTTIKMTATPTPGGIHHGQFQDTGKD
jgi:hypothetical protein